MLKRISVFAIFLLMTAISADLRATEVREEARAHFEKAVSIIEKATQISDYRNAVKELDGAIRVSPDWPDAHYALARVSAEINKPVRAVNEYRKYLQLAPNAEDKEKVENEIQRLEELRARQKRIGMAGISFAALPEGIYVMHVFSGSGFEKAGFQAGDKITAVNQKSIQGINLYDFFRVIEDNTAKVDASMERMKGRFQSAGRPQDLVVFGITRGGAALGVICSRKLFNPKIVEIEDDEFESEVLKASQPVIVTFWAKWCPPCLRFTPVMEGLAEQYGGGGMKFVNINIEENPAYAGKLEVKGVPAVMLIKGGKPIESLTGLQNKEKLEELIKKGM